MGSRGSTSYGRGMGCVELISGLPPPGEKWGLLLLAARGTVTGAGLLVAVAVVFQLGVPLVAAWVLAVVGGGGVTYLASRRVESVALVAAGGWP